MPIARVKLPNGKVGRFNIPEGMTKKQIENYIGKNKKLILVESPQVKKEPEKEPAKEDPKAKIVEEKKENKNELKMIEAVTNLAVATHNVARATHSVGNEVSRGFESMSQPEEESPPVSYVATVTQRDDDGLIKSFEIHPIAL